MKILAYLAIFSLIVVVIPIALIWAIEVLWGISIDLNMNTWFAAVIIIAILGGSSRSSK